MNKRLGERGATALFIVIFAMILFTTITMSFAQIMLNEQTRSIDNQLSQNALDAANAGVEDAKRVIMASVSGDDPGGRATSAINQDKCNTVQTSQVMGAVDEKEVLVQSRNDNGREVDMAYTCVKIGMESDDFVGKTTRAGESTLIPLKFKDKVDKVTIEWQAPGEYMPSELTPGSTCGPSTNVYWPKMGEWSSDCPTPLRAQFVTASSDSIGLSQMDGSNIASTYFLNPLVTSLQNPIDDIPFSARSSEGAGAEQVPQTVSCVSSQFLYACKASKSVSIAANSSISYLKIAGLYRGTSFKVTGYKTNGTLVPFSSGVQPVVDSTGRANDVFRRVKARLSLQGTATSLAPDFALDSSGPICKDFFVSKKPGSAGYSDLNASRQCSPSDNGEDEDW